MGFQLGVLLQLCELTRRIRPGRTAINASSPRGGAIHHANDDACKAVTHARARPCQPLTSVADIEGSRRLSIGRARHLRHEQNRARSTQVIRIRFAACCIAAAATCCKAMYQRVSLTLALTRLMSTQLPLASLTELACKLMGAQTEESYSSAL